MPQSLNLYSVRRAVALGNGAGGAAAESGDNRNADETFFPDQPDFHALPIRLHAENGLQSCIYKVSGFDLVPGFMQHGMKLQPHELQLGVECLQFAVGQPQQYLIR